MEQSAHVLVVEDDADIRRLIADFLRQSGYRVTSVRDGQELDRALGVSQIDLIVLDIMLPHEDGIALCKRLRCSMSTPIIMLTALGAQAERVAGLEAGADDYLTKPFNVHELLARIRAILRRAQSVLPVGSGRRYVALSFAGWQFEPIARRLQSPDGAIVALTRGEIDLLVAFCEHPNRVLSRQQLAALTRSRNAQPDRAVDLTVSRLRRKIEADPKDPLLLQTVHAEGYIFTPEVSLT